MTKLRITTTDDPATPIAEYCDPGQIAAALGAVGVDYGRWEASADLPADAGQDEVLAAYAADVARLAERGYATVDVARMSLDPSAPGAAEQIAAARGKFLAEHTHADDEIRFFVEGAGAFYLHLGEQVHTVLCQQGDYLSVPAGTTHWFDMGSSPRFTAIRFFQSPDGWVGEFTGSDIATRFPSYDELAAS